MNMPFYVPPEQMMKDRADYARKGIARGRSLVALECAAGVVIVAENPSRTLYKISEIYDRIAFAAVGRYNEYESLRSAGVRMADLRGYSYDRRDVTARALANAYSATLGSIFQEQGTKPFEVELCVAEVGASPAGKAVARISVMLKVSVPTRLPFRKIPKLPESATFAPAFSFSLLLSAILSAALRQMDVASTALKRMASFTAFTLLPPLLLAAVQSLL
jgi:hypothetical protein